jgi:uncharacterized protein (UPF0333 family)
MRLGSILVIFLVVALIYILPLIAANFSGTHTTEVKGVDVLDCTGCHSNILSELQATAESTRVFQVHSNAAGNTSYTTGFLNENITNTSNSKVCLLCHLAQIQITDSHTQLVVRACTDLDCHGNNETTNNTGYPVAGNISAKLGSTNAHEGWFDAMSGITSTRQNETGASYSNDFLTCIGCHTGTGVNINATEATYPHDDAGASQRRYF